MPHANWSITWLTFSFSEFRQIFARMSYTIMDKFGNEDAVFKAIGGLLFLRWVLHAVITKLGNV